MLRVLSSLCCLAVLPVAANAQCFESDFGVLCPRGAFPPGYGDDVLFDLQPMNLVFPMGGVAPSYTHAHIQSNGVVFLTNGAASGETTTGFSANATTQINNLRGTAGAPPRIATLWRDLDMQAGNGGGVYFNNTLPGRFVVTWANAVQFNTVSPVFTIQAQLYATGDVTFFYSGTTASSAAAIVGVSEGDAIAAVSGVDLSAGGNSVSTNLIYERFAANAFDLANHCIEFESAVGGGYMQSVGTPASHTSYGQGCYEFATESFYQPFSAPAASAALSGQSMVCTPTANGYLASWGGGTYQNPPGGATVLAVGDDDEVTVTPSTALPSPFGAASNLRVHGNAIISLGATPQTFPGAPNSYTPTPAALLAAPRTAFWSWHDYNTNETGSGDVTYHEAVVSGETIGYVTWDDVESYSQPGQANRSTLQFQLNLTTGVVTLVWVDIDGNGTSQYGSGHVIGFSPGGPSSDPGPVDLATALPIQTIPDGAPLLLSASPAPISTTTTGTLVTYTTSNIPEAAPASGVYLGANILSFAGVPEPGVELSFLGAPDCFAHVLTINLIQAMVGAVPTQSVTLFVPAGVPEGTQIYSQSIALVVPFSLPNGQNAFGLTTSNGIRTRVSSF